MKTRTLQRSTFPRRHDSCKNLKKAVGIMYIIAD